MRLDYYIKMSSPLVINKQTPIDYYGKKTKFPNILLAILSIFYHKHKRKWDTIILITGAVGSSKSTMAQGLAGVWQLLHNKKLDLSHFTWEAKGVSDFIDAEGNDLEPIIFDEAIKGGTGRDVVTKEGNVLKVGLVVGRRKRHIYFFIVDELGEFNKKIISRANLLIDMRTLMNKGREERGYFKLYNKDELQEIYWLLKNRSINYIGEYNGRASPFYRFDDWTNVFIDEEEYEKKKIEETRQQIETGGISWSETKIKAFYIWASTKKKLVDIATIVGVHPNTMTSWHRDFKKHSHKDDI